MDGTPRVRSGGFPQTPGTAAPSLRNRGKLPSPSPSPSPSLNRSAASSVGGRDSTISKSRSRSSLPQAPENINARAQPAQPLIPTTLIDAPQQRFYAFAVWFFLWAWRLFDYVQIIEGSASSFWYFTKWICIDFVFFFSLPSLRIPWLELSSPTVVTLFFLHFMVNWLLMFNIPMPWSSAAVALFKLVYDRGELAISEHNVKASTLLHNRSLISGKQIINILPEGSALLNPDRQPYCLGDSRSVVNIPIYFNSTVPVEVELVRLDLETNVPEYIRLSRSQIRDITKQAKTCCDDGEEGAYKYEIPVKKPGVYQLHRVLDEYKLEVHRLTYPTFVVPCPRAQVRTAESSSRCVGELSDLSLQVYGTPPLKIIYSRTINGQDHSFHYQSLQPEGFSSPLAGASRSSAAIHPDDENFSWASAQKVDVSLNESMTTSGEWQYSIGEVHDVFGNIVNYTLADEIEKPKTKQLFQNFEVRERPRANLRGCDLQSPLKVARGKSALLPVKIGRSARASNNLPYQVTWQFSPIETLNKNGDHGDVVQQGFFNAKKADEQPSISAPGLYTLRAISSESCEGEIEEPSSCLLLNPLEPRVTISSEEIPDKCAGSSIGLRVNLDVVGTPPFRVHYSVEPPDNRPRMEYVDMPGHRQQIELLPRSAGLHEYKFRRVEDAIYRNVPLPLTSDFLLEQNVKPPASAQFQHLQRIEACLYEPVKVDVKLSGEGPFTLEWELVHNGKKKSEKASGISGDTFAIETAPLSHGGEYTLALKNVQDQTGCRIFLKEEVKISVRMQQPRAAFGLIDGKSTTTVTEDATVNLPLRLSGDAPYRVSYRKAGSSGDSLTRVARSSNDFIEVKERGTYEIVDVQDARCPGVVDPKAASFAVDWFQRPEISLVPSDTIKPLDKESVFVKDDVCEGDIDGFEVALKGSSPFHVEYDVKHKPYSGSGSVARREFDDVSRKASINMETTKAGKYTYTFSALSDNLYNNDKKPATPLTIEQNVNRKPSAVFTRPGQTFKLCKSDEDYEERIPIKLDGVAPFYVEIELKHHSGNAPDIYRIPSIGSDTYGIQIPRTILKLGSQSVRIRRVRDARGCQTTSEAGPAVHIHLYEPPAIYPLEQRSDFCVGQRLGYTLSGTPPFEIEYTFGGKTMKAKSTTTDFRRLAESPGEFSIRSIRDKASECRAAVDLSKTIHQLPSVRMSKGKVYQVDIHEGSEVEIHFEFWGTPPFEFTYTRSTNARKGQKAQILETRHETSYENTKVVLASLEGTYEVVSIKDAHCSFSTAEAQDGPQKLLQL